MIRVIGVDPGINGALALVEDGELIDVADMPTAGTGTRRRVIPAAAGAWLRAPMINAVAIELVHSMPNQGVASSFRFGENFGRIWGAFNAVEKRIIEITSAKWKSTYRIKGDDQKEQARLIALQRWPEQSEFFQRKKDADRAEAALLAEHVRLLLERGVL